MSDYGGDFIVLTDDEGEEFELEHLDTLELEGKVYMAFIPADDSDDDDETQDIVILAVEQENGEEILVTVDDEEELNSVFAEFMKRIDEESDEPVEETDM